MLLTRQSKTLSRPVLNMASMIDVVFLLLIFFMCTSSFQKLENDLPTQLPQVGVGQDRQADDFDPVRIRLTRSGAGVLVTCDGLACATFDELAEQLRARRAIADVPVIIEGQGTVAFRHMVRALDACYREDLRRVAFSARGAMR
jgi:biopolymer transport protein ExbD